MQIIISSPSKEEINRLSKCPVWGCGVSKFDWHYDSRETALILEGEVTVEYNGISAKIAAGDLAVFPKGLSCMWNVTKPIKKHYEFG